MNRMSPLYMKRIDKEYISTKQIDKVYSLSVLYSVQDIKREYVSIDNQIYEGNNDYSTIKEICLRKVFFLSSSYSQISEFSRDDSSTQSIFNDILLHMSRTIHGVCSPPFLYSQGDIHLYLSSLFSPQHYLLTSISTSVLPIYLYIFSTSHVYIYTSYVFLLQQTDLTPLVYITYFLSPSSLSYRCILEQELFYPQGTYNDSVAKLNIDEYQIINENNDEDLDYEKKKQFIQESILRNTTKESKKKIWEITNCRRRNILYFEYINPHPFLKRNRCASVEQYQEMCKWNEDTPFQNINMNIFKNIINNQSFPCLIRNRMLFLFSLFIESIHNKHYSYYEITFISQKLGLELVEKHDIHNNTVLKISVLSFLIQVFILRVSIPNYPNTNKSMLVMNQLALEESHQTIIHSNYASIRSCQHPVLVQ